VSGGGVLDQLLRPGRTDAGAVRADVWWLVALAAVLMGAGLGLRDPWPADEPRFALIARDMLATGDWLLPRAAGELYAHKPPLYFWLLALSMGATGSLRVGFLLPSLLAGIATVLLVYDWLRRAHGREVGFAGALLLLVTVQFVWQARQAQIDATLCFLTTLSLYGLLRHRLIAAAPGWYVAGWAAAGLGVITKGVGFLSLLALVPLAVLTARSWPVATRTSPALAIAGPAAMLGAIACWFVPMWLATSASGELQAYRNEILFGQTLTRYGHAWQHREPVWYFVTSVIPWAWLPAIALVPWLWARWRAALRGRDTRIAVLLTWVLIVIAFFSASTGKRGVYVLPALPALVMAAAPWLPELLRARGPRRLAAALAALVACVLGLAAAYVAVRGEQALRRESLDAATLLMPLALATLGCALMLAVFRLRDAWLAWVGSVAVALLVGGFMVYPLIDASRSGRAFMQRVMDTAADVPELGFVGMREQFVLQLARPMVHFGRDRWREWEQEADDAAAWLGRDARRALVVDSRVRRACFAQAAARPLGHWHQDDWFLVSGVADPACASRGNPAAARRYATPPHALNT
jgi:4-amino-4-deoxy-L-arabinose transferase-like glycosyltransferase